MVTIAASLYLPEHIAMILRRAYYYAIGDSEGTLQKAGALFTGTAKEVVSSVTEIASSVTGSVGSKIAENVASVTGTAREVLGEAARRGADAVGEL